MYNVNEFLVHHSLIQFFKILYNSLRLKTCVATFSLDVPNVIYPFSQAFEEILCKKCGITDPGKVEIVQGHLERDPAGFAMRRQPG